MEITISENKIESGKRAAKRGAELIREAIVARGHATIIVATGASQFEMLEALVGEPDIDWSVVTGFHLDEYVGIPITHPASFRKYLWERFVSKLPLPLKAFHYLDAASDPVSECTRVGELLSTESVDVAFIGIGENGHVAFNDPPADFEVSDPYIVVDLDEACRQQQLGEGWFPSFDAVPKQAVSMSAKQIMKSAAIICTVPDERKAEAVANATQRPITPDVPASILQNHANYHLYLDEAAASKRS
ncbi:glucosamine-6-phosphate deaminase [bacterium]|nr:glucosamine-6-phosphate deaminase [bacterium]